MKDNFSSTLVWRESFHDNSTGASLAWKNVVFVAFCARLRQNTITVGFTGNFLVLRLSGRVLQHNCPYEPKITTREDKPLVRMDLSAQRVTLLWGWILSVSPFAAHRHYQYHKCVSSIGKAGRFSLYSAEFYQLYKLDGLMVTKCYLLFPIRWTEIQSSFSLRQSLKTILVPKPNLEKHCRNGHEH